MIIGWRHYICIKSCSFKENGFSRNGSFFFKAIEKQPIREKKTYSCGAADWQTERKGIASNG